MSRDPNGTVAVVEALYPRGHPDNAPPIMMIDAPEDFHWPALAPL